MWSPDGNFVDATAVLALLGGPLMDWTPLVVALLLLTAWLFVCNWMATDVPYVGADKNLWFGIAFGTGAAGFALFMLFPVLLVAMLFWAVLVAGLGFGYAFYRNTLVPRPEMRVLTPEWFQQVIRDLGSRGSVKVNKHSGNDASYGPADVKWQDGPGVMHDVPEDPDFRDGFDKASAIVQDALSKRATELSFVPVGDKEGRYQLTLQIDGFSNASEKLHEKQAAHHVMLWMKKVAGLDLNEYRKPQKNKMSVVVGKKKMDLLLETQGTSAGPEMRVRVMDKATLRRVGDLGLSPDLMEKMGKMCALTKGLFIVGGQPHSGITTTLYALVREHDLFQYAAATIEDPIYMEIENVTQQEFNNDGGKVAYSKAVQSFMRGKDPDIMVVGKSDPDTIPIAAAFAERKKIYQALECTSAVEGLGKVIKACGDGELVTKSLIGVSCQKLIRVLCNDCKVAYKPSPDALKRLNVSPDRVAELFRPPTPEEAAAVAGGKGCAKCQGTGYLGQTGAFELLVMTDALRQMVLSGSPLKDIQTEARKDKMAYLHEQILKKVIDGVTSVQELMRVMQGPGGGR
jgi:type II secretory ATPase GspE/PulE/Tfp pilus assembly ATPase PilB-like protein